MLVLPLGSPYHGTVWFVSSVLLSAIGFYMGPHTHYRRLQLAQRAALRRNAMLLPLYQVFLLPDDLRGPLRLPSSFRGSKAPPSISRFCSSFNATIRRGFWD